MQPAETEMSVDDGIHSGVHPSPRIALAPLFTCAATVASTTSSRGEHHTCARHERGGEYSVNMAVSSAEGTVAYSGSKSSGGA